MKNKLQFITIGFLKYIFIGFLSLLFIPAFAPDMKVAYICSVEPVDAYDRLVKAIVQVESAGDTLAYNLSEESVGAFQIRPIRLLDYYQRTGINYKLKDCHNFEISKEIFLYYARLTGYPDYEIIARNWNGSGNATLDYWKKVKSNL